jgi:hypothetical protein
MAKFPFRMITTYMYNVQPADLVSAMDFFNSANSLTNLHDSIHSLVSALIRLFRAYCRSSLTNFSVLDPLEGDKHSAGEGGEIKDAAGCNEKLLLFVESAHNLPAIWQSKYKAFFLEAHLMYGPKSFGMSASSMRILTNKTNNNFPFVPLEHWVDFDVHISALPRESQVCFILRGIPLLEEGSPIQMESIGQNAHGSSSTVSSGYGSARNSANNENGIFHIQLATASLPLYNVEG